MPQLFQHTPRYLTPRQAAWLAGDFSLGPAHRRGAGDMNPGPSGRDPHGPKFACCEDVTPTHIPLKPGRIALLAVLTGLLGCGEVPYLAQAIYKAQRMAEMGPSVALDLPAIEQRDTLVVIAPYNSTSYFLYRAEPMGYEYELLQKFAEEMDVKLRMLVVTERDSMFKLLRAGKGDIVAARLVGAPEDSGVVAYTRPLYATNPVLVQRSAGPPAVVVADTAPALGGAAEPATLPPITPARVRQIQRPSQLQGQRVDVPEQSPYTRTLIELADTLTGDIHVVEVDASSEALIRAVSEGTIRYTVAQGNIADISSDHYTNIVVRPALGEAAPIAWAVRPNAPQLHARLNQWLANEKNASLLQSLYTKYFIHSAGYHQRMDSPFLTSETGRLSEYDTLFKEGAKKIGWDWRLLASQAYQESKFQPRARSWAGASGLLQLMPRTAAEFKVRNATDPEENVAGAVRFLGWLTNYWTQRIEDPDERLKFILASYNTGSGHVEDAQRLAEQAGDDPTKWADVSYWLLQKSKREVYTNPVVKYGYSRGIEPVNYVSIILERFQQYRQAGNE
ncbi:MAG: transporter substrate-binding domain-containing protein [Gemmatimonadaceae bacterium]|nr:transporter substrate-binding domain-containing protein [Gemmatimonadaceae bacterium]